MSQSIATTFGQAYTLSLWLGVSTTDTRYAGPVSVVASAGGTSAILANVGTTTMSATNTLWTQALLPFTATSSSTVISIVGQSSTGGQFIGLDNISVTPVLASSVSGAPEPASWLLMMAGVGGAGFAMRRKERANRSFG